MSELSKLENIATEEYLDKILRLEYFADNVREATESLNGLPFELYLRNKIVFLNEKDNMIYRIEDSRQVNLRQMIRFYFLENGIDLFEEEIVVRTYRNWSITKQRRLKVFEGVDSQGVARAKFMDYLGAEKLSVCKELFEELGLQYYGFNNCGSGSEEDVGDIFRIFDYVANATVGYMGAYSAWVLKDRVGKELYLRSYLYKDESEQFSND